MLKKPSITVNPASSMKKIKLQPRKIIESLIYFLSTPLTGPISIVIGLNKASEIFAFIKRESSELAGILISRSLFASMLTLLTERDIDFQVLESAIQKLILEIITEEDIEITNDFFLYPDQLPQFKQIVNLFLKLMEFYDIPNSEAQAIGNRLSPYFVNALNTEWTCHYSDYETVFLKLDSPFNHADHAYRAWEKYYSDLEREINQPLLNREAFSLKQIYIPLRSYRKEQCDQIPISDNKNRSTEKKKFTFCIDYIHNFIHEWIGQTNNNDTLRLVSGGPGSGKSSFSKILATEIAENRKYNVIHISLKDHNVSTSFEESLKPYIHSIGIQESSINEIWKSKPLIIIYDGLDEISHTNGRWGEESAVSFIREQERALSIYNRYDQQWRLKIIFFGRELSIQMSSYILSENYKRNILYMLPYYILDINKLFGKNEVIENIDGIIQIDQRLEWWTRYCSQKGKRHKSIPSQLRHQSIDELTALPLLNYLVASVYFDDQDSDIFTKSDFNLNRVYDKILNMALEKEKKEPHPVLKEQNIDKTTYRELLENIAEIAWHDNSMHIHSDQVLDMFKKCNFQKNIMDNYSNQHVSHLLLAFYFRKADTDYKSDSCYEFTHKTFREYLTSCCIIRKLKGLISLHESPQYRNTISVSDCLEKWSLIFGSKLICIDLYQFIKNEVALNKEDALKWQKFIVQLINENLKEGLQLSSFKSESFRDGLEYSRNYEIALLSLHSACSEITEEVSIINWENEDSANEWFKRIFFAYSSTSTFYERHFTNQLIFDNQILRNVDLQQANLEFSSFQNADLSMSNLIDTNLLGACLQKSDLSYSFLWDSVLDSADLCYSELIETNFSGASLCNANFGYSYTFRVCFQETILDGSDFVNSYLLEAQFGNAVMKKVNLNNTDLTDADLSGTILEGSSFCYSILKNVNFSKASVDDVDFRNAKLKLSLLKKTKGTPRFLPNGKVPKDDFRKHLTDYE